MKQGSSGSLLSTVFVDYDNIYLSLKRKDEDAAKRFAKDAGSWLAAIENGALLTPTNGSALDVERRIVMSRCYGNPVPRRNKHDNSTDMNSFPFVRNHFLRSGFEVIDCPPLTAQLKNSADIRMVMDIRDFLTHDTYFDEFIILSGDSDFTPVLHRLRAHARRTVIYANEHTAVPYTAISDGEVREADLMALLMDGKLPTAKTSGAGDDYARLPSVAQLAALRSEILAEITSVAKSSSHPIPLETLADRAVRSLGHDKTVGSAWAGAGSFREFVSTHLRGDIQLSDQPPYFVFDASRQMAPDGTPRQPTIETRIPSEPQVLQVPQSAGPLDPFASPTFSADPFRDTAPTAPTTGTHPQSTPANYAPQHAPAADPARTAQPNASTASRAADSATAIQESIGRIHEACQAPPLSPPEYRALFEIIAREINENKLKGEQTLSSIVERARSIGVNLQRDDARFVLDVISESDPWFEQGASANLFASRFRNFVITRCRSQNLSLTADEIDLIDAWFLGVQSKAQAAVQTANVAQAYQPAPSAPQPQHQPTSAPSVQPQHQQLSEPQQPAQQKRWWNAEPDQAPDRAPQQPAQPQHASNAGGAPGQQNYGQQAVGQDSYQDRYADNQADLADDGFPRILSGGGRR